MTTNHKLSWNDKTTSFVALISEKRVAKLVADSRWNEGRLSQMLCAEFGDSVPPGLAYGLLRGIKAGAWESASPTQRARVCAEVFGAVCEARDRVDAILSQWLLCVETAASSGEGLASVAEKIVADVLQQTGADDRWFAEVVEILDLCFQALESDVDDSAVELIAERTFSSWVAPTRDAVLRFADEMAALGMRSQFRRRYGDPETDPAS